MGKDLYGIGIADLQCRCEFELAVAVIEEYGYKSWIWLPGCAPGQLEISWLLMGHVPTTDPPTFLPGEWLEVDRQPDWEAFSELHSALFQRRGPGQLLTFVAYIDGDDCYTKLVTPDGRLLFHMGVEGNVEDEIDRWLNPWVPFQDNDR